uniref:Uncharacterized protein n=1 Tax=Panagrellus redivivus TaxID=6233 RepID=A0A7E4UU56_PANRE
MLVLLFQAQNWPQKCPRILQSVRDLGRLLVFTVNVDGVVFSKPSAILNGQPSTSSLRFSVQDVKSEA